MPVEKIVTLFRRVEDIVLEHEFDWQDAAPSLVRRAVDGMMFVVSCHNENIIYGVIKIKESGKVTVCSHLRVMDVSFQELADKIAAICENTTLMLA